MIGDDLVVEPQPLPRTWIFGVFAEAEVVLWARVIKDANITAN
jgi:hypothetical protein